MTNGLMDQWANCLEQPQRRPVGQLVSHPTLPAHPTHPLYRHGASLLCMCMLPYAPVRHGTPWHTMPQRLPIPRCLRDLWTCVGLHVLTVRPHMTSHVHHIMPSYLLWHNTRGGIHWVYMGLPAVRLGSAVTCWQYGAEMVAVRDDVTQAGTEKHRDEGYDTWPLLGKVCEYNRM